MTFKSFFDIYKELLVERDNWNYYSQNNEEANSEQLFEAENALYFIKNIFKYGGKEDALRILDDARFPMSKYRSNHTLSAFLFGIALRNELHIDMKELPKISNKPTKNFLYFWSLTCLYHDFSVAIEDKSNEIIDDVLTLEKLENFFNIEYSFIEASEFGELASNYYKYRIEEKRKADHGIVSAIIFYDAMMKIYQKAKQYQGNLKDVESKSSFIYNGYNFSADFEKHIRLIANTIARHNMWVATEQTERIYIKYNLHELIVSDDSKKISMNDNNDDIKDKLLFLLGLVDTLEPIKILGRSQNSITLKNPYIILERMKLGFHYTGKKRTILIQCDERHLNDYKSSISGIDNWMDVIYEDANEIQITITKDV